MLRDHLILKLDCNKLFTSVLIANFMHYPTIPPQNRIPRQRINNCVGFANQKYFMPSAKETLFNPRTVLFALVYMHIYILELCSARTPMTGSVGQDLLITSHAHPLSNLRGEINVEIYLTTSGRQGTTRGEVSTLPPLPPKGDSISGGGGYAMPSFQGILTDQSCCDILSTLHTVSFYANPDQIFKRS